MTPEGLVKAAIRKILAERKCYVFWPVVTAYGKKTVDCLACYKGIFLAIEAKAPNKKPTENQKATLDEITAAGGFSVVEDSVECDKLLYTLELIDELFYGNTVD